MNMIPSLFLVQRYLPSNDFTNDESIKFLKLCSLLFLIQTETLLLQEVDISVLLGENQYCPLVRCWALVTRQMIGEKFQGIW